MTLALIEHPIRALETPEQCLQDLLASLGLDPEAGCRNVVFTSADPIVPSRFKLGTASAVALAAQAVGIRDIWRSRAGEDQTLEIDIGQAAYPGLCTFLHISQNGHRLPFMRERGDMSGNFFETRDGRRFYLFYNANYVDHCLRVHRFLGATTSTDSIQEKLHAWDGDALEAALAERRLIGAYARTRQEWLAHPQGAWLNQLPPVAVLQRQASPPEALGPGARPLSGVRVVDMGHVLAGPVVSRVLAEQGAEVIHVSAPHQPDGHLIDLDTGWGKRTAFIDLEEAEDRRRLRALIASADVFIHSWRPGALDRRGFSAQEMHELRPGLIYATVSCYGHDGPWSSRGGYEPMGQTVSGLAIAEGSADTPRLASTFTLNDYLTAYLSAAGVVSALLRRMQQGGSYEVHASLTRTSMWVQELGPLEAACQPDGPLGVTQIPQINAKWLQEADSVFGKLTHPAPIVQYEKTPAFWARPPMPAGAAHPEWVGLKEASQ